MSDITIGRHRILIGDVRERLRDLPDDSVHCVVTSPPYFGLRDYGVSGQIGLEPTLADYLATMVDVFREVRRVLRPDGTCWLNIGDSYHTDSPVRTKSAEAFSETWDPSQTASRGGLRKSAAKSGTFKNKDLMMVPARLAIALQDDGWWLRSDIIWAKKAPMPESVTDRPTSAHEHVFLLAKQPRYFYDADAVREESVSDHGSGNGYNRPEQLSRGGRGQVEPWKVQPYRNLRNVWLLGPEPFPSAHFATYPTEIPRRAIKAGTSERGVCAACGSPWVRQVERIDKGWDGSKYGERAVAVQTTNGGTAKSTLGSSNGKMTGSYETTGWAPSCACDADGSYEPDDFDVIETPTGERSGEDPTMLTGRKGMNRPRGESEGTRSITRYEQRRYAEQLRLSPHRDEMEREAGTAFAHYIRTDRSGARPVPDAMLDGWIARGWVSRVAVPFRNPPDPVPATVLDPFLGSGTTMLVADQLGRTCVGIELNPEYALMAEKRVRSDAPLLVGMMTGE